MNFYEIYEVVRKKIAPVVAVGGLAAVLGGCAKPAMVEQKVYGNGHIENTCVHYDCNDCKGHKHSSMVREHRLVIIPEERRQERREERGKPCGDHRSEADCPGDASNY
jgi:hypothetical protein